MRSLLVLNGKCDLEYLRGIVGGYDTIVGVDGGCKSLLAIGMEPNLAIGDFDSFDPNLLKTSRVLEFPQDKDEIDAQLALDFCQSVGVDEVDVACWEGERLDMIYALIGLMTRFPEGWVELVSKDLRIGIVKRRRRLEAKIGEKWSILPIGDEVVLSLKGFKYTLDRKSMRKDFPYGVSNVAVSESVEIEVHKGEAVYFRWLREPS